MGYVVALTGGIGSGKSIIANAFSDLGINVIDADIIARQVTKPNTSALYTIVSRAGNTILNRNGTLNRRVLRERIFSNPSEKKWLNALLHPIIHQETQRQISQATSPYVLWVVPLLVENQLMHNADRVLVVDVLPQTQIQRVMARDNISCQDAKRILSAQASREARLAVADDVIYNDSNSTLDVIRKEVACLHARYMNLFSKVITKGNHNFVVY